MEIEHYAFDFERRRGVPDAVVSFILSQCVERLSQGLDIVEASFIRELMTSHRLSSDQVYDLYDTLTALLAESGIMARLDDLRGYVIDHDCHVSHGTAYIALELK